MRTRMIAILSALGVTAAMVAFVGAPIAEGAVVGKEYVAQVSVTGGDGVQRYRIHLIEDIDIADAFRSLKRQSAAFPNGRIVRKQTEYNVGYSWHIDPKNVAFVALSMEVCDGLPSDVESGALTSDRYCPWSGRVVSMTRIR